MHIIDIPQFIKTHITKRGKSLFEEDIHKYKNELAGEISGKSVLVIGGAGTIGSSFIKAVLDFEPARLYAVSYTHLRAHETVLDFVFRLLLEKKKHHIHTH